MRDAIQLEIASDWERLGRAKRGEDEAFKLLMKRHESRILALVLLMTGCPATAREVTQAAFVRLYESDLAHQNGSVGGLLTTIAYRLALKEMAREKKHTDLEGVEPEAAVPSPLHELIREERDRHVAEAIGRLDSDHRDVLLLRFYGGHSYEEISRIMNVPLGTVKSRIFYAVKTCQSILRIRGLLE